MQQTNGFNSNAPALFEYTLVAHPDCIVSDKVIAEKEIFTEEYLQIGTDIKPQITIASFVAHEAMEETVLRYMHRVCSRQRSFEIALNNYSGIPPHTIYLRIQNPQPFKQLAKELSVVSNYVTSCSCPPFKITSNPHLSLAMQLPESIYSKAIISYSKKCFHEKFVVSELVLLKRNGEYETNKPVYVFRLQPNDLCENTHHVIN